jgi:hypothetical protein
MCLQVAEGRKSKDLSHIIRWIIKTEEEICPRMVHKGYYKMELNQSGIA